MGAGKVSEPRTTIVVHSASAIEIAKFLRHLAVAVETKAERLLDGHANALVADKISGAIKVSQ